MATTDLQLILLQQITQHAGAGKRMMEVELVDIIGAIRHGIITPATKQALEDAEARLDEAKRRMKEIEDWQPSQMLPRARQIYRTLAERLERIEDVADALSNILGEEIKLVPDNGYLWAELKAACAALSQITVVAGAGFEPTTFGL